MLKYTKKIAEENNFKLIEGGSAAEVLYNLNLGSLDIGFIGRKAEKREFSGYEKLLRENGCTLIFSQKSMINQVYLREIEAHTYLDKEIVKNNFPELKKVVFHKSLNESLRSGEINLIRWSDWRDNFNLLIPIDDFGNKIEKFRIPALYSKDKIIETINIESIK